MNKLVLDTTTKSLAIKLGEAHTVNPVDVTAHYADTTSTPTITEGSNPSQSNGTAFAEILAAPAASTKRVVVDITVVNNDTVVHIIKLYLRVSGGSDYLIKQITLQDGESWAFGESAGGAGGGVTDHGDLTGLADDDHPQYIKHSLATAVNDFLVASGVGVFVKKTLAEVITILGLQDLAFLDTVGTAQIDNDAVTYAKIQDVSATDRFLGRDTAGAGNVEEIAPAAARTMLNVADGANNYVHPNHSGDVTSVADGAQTIADDAVNFAKMQNIATDKLIGRDTAATGSPEEIGLGASLGFDGAGNIQRSAFTGEITASTNSNTPILDKTAITGKTLVTAVGADHVLIADASDSDNLKKASVSDLIGSSYTDEQAQDAIGSVLLDTDTVDFIYDDATPNISAVVQQKVNAQTGVTYTYVAGDRGKLVTHSNALAIAGTMPQAGGSFPAGWFLDVENTGVGTLTITPVTSLIDGGVTLVLTTNQGARIFSDGTNYFTQRGMGGGGSYTDEQAQDAIGAMIADTTTIDLTYTDGTPELKADVKADSVGVALMHATATDKLFGRVTAGAGAGEEITATAAGRALLDDADAAAQRTTLGLGPIAQYDGDAYTGDFVPATADTNQLGTTAKHWLVAWLNKLYGKRISAPSSPPAGTLSLWARDSDAAWVKEDSAGVETKMLDTLDAGSTTDVLTGTSATKYPTADAIAALWEKGSNVASAGTIALGEGDYFHITGTTTITDIDWTTAKDGRKAWLIFDGALTLTHNATTLILPSGANIVTRAGDRACFVQDSSDNVICLAYVRADGSPVGQPRVQAVTSSATVTPNAYTDDMVVITAQAAALTIANPSGTSVQGQKLIIRLKDNATARAITFGSEYRAMGQALPTTTTISKTIYMGFIRNSTDAKWDIIAATQEV